MQHLGRVEFEQGYAPSARELWLEGTIKLKEGALEKCHTTIEKLQWEIDIYRKFVSGLLTSGHLTSLELIKQADKVLKCATIKRTYDWGGGD